jgi:hypothetical protein
MNTFTEVLPTGSTVSERTVLSRLFILSYLTAIVTATIGWVSAFGWIGLRIAKWLLA